MFRQYKGKASAIDRSIAPSAVTMHSKRHFVTINATACSNLSIGNAPGSLLLLLTVTDANSRIWDHS